MFNQPVSYKCFKGLKIISSWTLNFWQFKYKAVDCLFMNTLMEMLNIWKICVKKFGEGESNLSFLFFQQLSTFT